MKDKKTDIILKRALYDAMKIQVNTYDELDNNCNYEFSEEFKLKMNNLIKVEAPQSETERKCKKIHHLLCFVLCVHLFFKAVLILNLIYLLNR